MMVLKHMFQPFNLTAEEVDKLRNGCSGGPIIYQCAIDVRIEDYPGACNYACQMRHTRFFIRPLSVLDFLIVPLKGI